MIIIIHLVNVILTFCTVWHLADLVLCIYVICFDTFLNTCLWKPIIKVITQQKENNQSILFSLVMVQWESFECVWVKMVALAVNWRNT